jgi:hypothetical protein
MQFRYFAKFNTIELLTDYEQSNLKSDVFICFSDNKLFFYDFVLLRSSIDYDTRGCYCGDYVFLTKIVNI